LFRYGIWWPPRPAAIQHHERAASQVDGGPVLVAQFGQFGGPTLGLDPARLGFGLLAPGQGGLQGGLGAAGVVHRVWARLAVRVRLE
jgi:hypothetical protein